MIRTSAGGVVVNTKGQLVLVLQHGNTWSLPKGGIDEGESSLDAAKREIWEETGLGDVASLGFLGTYERYSIDKEGTGELKELGLRPRMIYLFTTKNDAFVIQDSEISEARWVTFDEALVLLSHPKDKEFLLSSRGQIYDLLQEAGIQLK